MASAYVQSKTNIAAATLSPAVTLTAPPTSGNWLVAFIWAGGSETTIDISGWSKGTPQSNANVSCRTFWKQSDGSEQTVTGSLTTSRAYGMSVIECSGVSGEAGETSSANSSGTRITGSASPSGSGNAMAVCFRGNRAQSTASAESVTGTGAGSVNEREDANSASPAIGIAAWTAPITGISGGYQGGWTDSSNAANAGAIVVLADAVAGAPTNTVAPAVTGTTVQGSTLTSTTGTWTGSPTFAYQWMQDDGINPPATISGATAATRVLAASDVGFNIFCAVTATNGSGSASANSNEVGPITGAGYTLVSSAFTYLGSDAMTTFAVDVYVPGAPNGYGLVLIHGGQWDSNDRTVLTTEGAFFANLGYTCFAGDFTQVGGGITVDQEMIDDVALMVAGSRGSSYASALTKMAMLGESSGGHLAYMVACTKTSTQKPDAVVGWSPATDFTDPAIQAQPADWTAIKNYLNDPAPSSAKQQQFSPLYQVTSACCPMRIAGSQNEQIPISQFDNMYATTASLGVDVVEQTYPGSLHSRLTPKDGAATDAWLLTVLASTPPTPTPVETGGGFVRPKRPSVLFTDNMDSDELVAFSLALTSLRRRRLTTGTTSEASKGGAL